MRWRASDVAAAVGGELRGADIQLDGASIDSRSVRPGQLFVPIVGERDGHDFVDAARAAGAAAHLTARGGGAPEPVIVVADTALALLDLGRLARTGLPDRVIGITGSVGKTTTKDLLRTILERRYRTAASERSFNNELGVPLTLANAPPATEAAVIEMGARDRGHIALLCDVARPTIGVVTVVAGAHLEVFGSIDDVARAKGELIEALPSDGTAVLNADDERVAAMAARSTAPVRTFGQTSGDVRAEAVTLDDEVRPSFRLVSDDGGGRGPAGPARPPPGRRTPSPRPPPRWRPAARSTTSSPASRPPTSPGLRMDLRRAASGRTRPGRLLQRQPHVDDLRPRCARRAAGPPPNRRAGRDGRAGGGLGVGPPGDRCRERRSWASR